MLTFWNSLEAVSFVNTCAQWLASITTIFVVILTMRQSKLQKDVDAFIRAETDRQIVDAKMKANESLVKLQPREVTSKQKELFLLSTKTLDKGKITVIPLMGNAESNQYANELVNLLSTAGYTVTKGGMMPMDGVPTGLGLTVKPNERYPKYAEGLSHAFAAAGIACGTGYNGLQNENVLGLVVGTKP